MSSSANNALGIASSSALFKAQALQAMVFSGADNDLFSLQSNTGDLFGTMLAKAKVSGLATPTTPTGLDTSQPFSTPGQNVMTVINRVEISFKAQYTKLSELKGTLAQEQDAAQQLMAIHAQASDDNIKSALKQFVESYNAGVNRFAAEVAQGGILEGSPEAARARFATQRDINNPLLGADGGVRGGMRALGVSVDPKTGLAELDEAKLMAALEGDNHAQARTITEFAHHFIATVNNLNAQGNPQDRQLANLSRAIQWIADNRESVLQEFGPGSAATPNQAFAQAAAAYQSIARR